MSRKRIVILVAGFLGFSAFASILSAQPYPDSLLRRYDQAEQIPDKVALSYALGAFYTDIDIDSSDWWFRQSLSLAQDIQDSISLGKVYLDFGISTCAKRGDMEEGLALLNLALGYNLQVGEHPVVAKNHLYLGRTYDLVGNFSLALDHYKNARKLYDAVGDSAGLGKLYNYMGILYSVQKDWDQAIRYGKESLEINQKLGLKDAQFRSYNDLSVTYIRAGRYQEALKYIEKGLGLKNTERQFRNMLLNNMATVKEFFGEYDSAVYYLKQSLEISKEANDQRGIGWTQQGLGKAYLGLNKLDLALSNAHEALAYAEEGKELILAQQSVEVITDAYARKKDYAKAYEYQVKYRLLSDSVFNEEKVRSVASLESEYEYNKAQQLKELELRQQEELFQAELDKQGVLRNSLVGGIVGVLIFLGFIFRSYLQKRKANEKLRSQNDLISEQAENLKKLNAAKNRFFSIISHDLRGPMNIFHGMSHMIKVYLEGKEYDELEEFADDVKDTAVQVSQLLDNLLTWAVRQEDQFPFHLEELDLKTCIDENVAIFTSIAASKNIEFQSEVNEEFQVWADKNSLMTILRNLINNAMKFTPAGGRVSVSVARKEEYGVLKVVDNGIGIPKEKLETLFEMQDRIVTKGTAGEKGVGLGLQLVHDFVKMNNGKIEVTSRKDLGTEFTVYIPTKDLAA